jgi:hypothetical protein
VTDTAITQQGDSGALTLDDATDDVVGHVVGATANVASYIQEIDYQLREIAKQAQFSSVTL